MAALAVCFLAAAPAFTIVPSVVVYPPAAGSDAIDRDLIAHITDVLAKEIGSAGNVKVLAAQPDLDRGRYRADARARGADYFVTGFATQIGSRLTLILQVVSAQSGTVAFSTQATVDGDRDVASQGEQLRFGILERSARAIQALQATPPPPEPSPSATPSPQPNHH
jgi:TolB-like protein